MITKERSSGFIGGALATVLLLLTVLLNLVILAGRLSGLNLAGSFKDFDPKQPIAFSHRLHSGEILISCDYCHTSARSERYAGFPSAQLCMNCHRFVQATLGAVREEEQRSSDEKRAVEPVKSDEIGKIYKALGIDWQLQPTDSSGRILWTRVHQLPDFTFFHHGVHSAAGIECAKCHGAVDKMERLRQTEDLSMGWCVDCHREYSGRSHGMKILQPTTDCGGCHY